MGNKIDEKSLKKIHTFFPKLRRFRSIKKLERSPLYRGELSPLVSQVLNRCDFGGFASAAVVPKKNYRAVNWNVERGMVFDGIIDILKGHPEMAAGDIFFLPETDWGMARSQNRNVAKELAKSLRMNYAFVPCYINLDKGNGMETARVDGENELGLHGNTILSPWPMKNIRSIRLKNCKDKMRGKEKRLGSQRAVVVDLILPGGPLRAVCVHLDANSSQYQRFLQTKTILDFLDKEKWDGPTLLGGDWNTSTYCANHAFFVFWSFWRKVAMGPKYVCENHYIYPERYFERRLFQFLEKRGYDYKNFNALGVPTIHYQLGDEQKNQILRDWTPHFFQPFVNWAMKKAEGLASFKIDWFAAQKLKPIEGSQKVIGSLRYKGEPVSDHDATLVDFETN